MKSISELERRINALEKQLNIKTEAEPVTEIVRAIIYKKGMTTLFEEEWPVKLLNREAALEYATKELAENPKYEKCNHAYVYEYVRRIKQ